MRTLSGSETLRGQPQPVSADDARKRARPVGLRAGRSHPIARPRAGPDAAAARRGLPGRRPRGALCVAADRRGFLHQLRLRDAARAGADAPALVGVADRRQQARQGDPRVRARARIGASARGRCALLAWHGHQLLGRILERDDAHARVDALQGPASRVPPRGRHPHLRDAGARSRPRRRRGEARRVSTASSTPSCRSTRRFPRRA